jgi:hypothetical protein
MPFFLTWADLCNCLHQEYSRGVATVTCKTSYKGQFSFHFFLKTLTFKALNHSVRSLAIIKLLLFYCGLIPSVPMLETWSSG